MSVEDADTVAAGTGASDTASPAVERAVGRVDLMIDVADSSVVASLHYLVARMR